MQACEATECRHRLSSETAHKGRADCERTDWAPSFAKEVKLGSVSPPWSEATSADGQDDCHAMRLNEDQGDLETPEDTAESGRLALAVLAPGTCKQETYIIVTLDSMVAPVRHLLSEQAVVILDCHLHASRDQLAVLLAVFPSAGQATGHGGSNTSTKAKGLHPDDLVRSTRAGEETHQHTSRSSREEKEKSSCSFHRPRRRHVLSSTLLTRLVSLHCRLRQKSARQRHPSLEPSAEGNDITRLQTYA